MQALEGESIGRLGWVVRLIQSEARQRAVFADAAQLAKTAGACCYACEVGPAALAYSIWRPRTHRPPIIHNSELFVGFVRRPQVNMRL